MEEVLTVVFRISNPQYSFVPARLELDRESVDRLQTSRLLRDVLADCVPGGFEYTARMIVETQFQIFHYFSPQVPVQSKNHIQTFGLPFVRQVKTDIRDDRCGLQSAE